MKEETKPGRISEIDLLRGTAVMMMILFHTVFDIDYYNICQVNILAGPGSVFGYVTGFLFVFIAGISAWISGKRASCRMDKKRVYIKFLKRGAFIFSIGMGITIVTWIFAPGDAIVFGTLHLIGISIMLAPLFFGLSVKNIYIGLAVVFAGLLVHGIAGDPLLTLIGIPYPGFSTLDYKPLIPWFGYFLSGMALSAYLYPEGIKEKKFEEINNPVSGFIRLAGRNSLVIYLVHQPLIIILLSLYYGQFLLFP